MVLKQQLIGKAGILPTPHPPKAPGHRHAWGKGWELGLRTTVMSQGPMCLAMSRSVLRPPSVDLGPALMCDIVLTWPCQHRSCLPARSCSQQAAVRATVHSTHSLPSLGLQVWLVGLSCGEGSQLGHLHALCLPLPTQGWEPLLLGSSESHQSHFSPGQATSLPPQPPLQ